MEGWLDATRPRRGPPATEPRDDDRRRRPPAPGGFPPSARRPRRGEAELLGAVRDRMTATGRTPWTWDEVIAIALRTGAGAAPVEAAAPLTTGSPAPACTPPPRPGPRSETPPGSTASSPPHPRHSGRWYRCEFRSPTTPAARGPAPSCATTTVASSRRGPGPRLPGCASNPAWAGSTSWGAYSRYHRASPRPAILGFSNRPSGSTTSATVCP